MNRSTKWNAAWIVLILAVLALVATFAFAGCGSGNATTTTAASTQTTVTPTTTAPPSTGSSDTTAATTATTVAAGPATGTPYKVAVLSNISGDLAFLGKFITESAQMEVDNLNANGGVDGHPIQLVIEDDGNDPTKAAAAFTKLADDPSVLAITGTCMTPLLPGLQALAEQKQIPYIAACPELPELRAQNPKWTFAIGADEFVNAAAMFDIVKAKGYKSIICISENDALSIAIDNEFIKDATAAGLKAVLLADTVDLGAVDVTPQVNKLKALVDKQGADCIVSTVWPNYTGTFRKTMTAAGLDLPMVSYSVTADPSTLGMGGPELNGLMVPGPKVQAVSWLPDSDPQKKAVTDFVARYEAKFKTLPGQVAVSAGDLVVWLADALKTSGADRTKLRDALASVRNLVGPFSIRTLGAPGDNSGAQPGVFTPMVIDNMKFVELKLK
jgi:branched-chain amino acid transport system substrate-binding protein